MIRMSIFYEALNDKSVYLFKNIMKMNEQDDKSTMSDLSLD